MGRWHHDLVTVDRLLVAVGQAAHLECDAVLDLGPFHPSAHAGLQLEIGTSDGLITFVDPHIGLMHRSAEKLFEVRDYRQILMLANRHDWLAPFSSELGVALVVESATGIVPSQRATWSRMVLAEATNIMAGLAFLGTATPDGSLHALLRHREEWTAWLERATGSRVHPMITRIGGLAQPISDEVLSEAVQLAVKLSREIDNVHSTLERLYRELDGLAVLTTESALHFAVSGPVARASGIDLDIRRIAPYLAYDQLADQLSLTSSTAGDAAARYRALVEQVTTSALVLPTCVDQVRAFGDQPIDVPLPKTLKVPEGTYYVRTENPMGTSGWLLDSTGDKTPWRLKIRSSSFANLQAMPAALIDMPIDRLAEAVRSFFVLMGDVDR
jgi:NADH-quinone oxidoreductase subunit D